MAASYNSPGGSSEITFSGHGDSLPASPADSEAKKRLGGEESSSNEETGFSDRETDFTDLSGVDSSEDEATPPWAALAITRALSFSCDLWHPINRAYLMIDQWLPYLHVHGGVLHQAPLPHRWEGNVLEIGCGRGSWSKQYALSHPQVYVHGIDPTPFNHPHLPTNCSLERHRFGDRSWPVHARRYNLVRGSRLSGRVQNWVAFVGEAQRVLKPGGFLEVSDISRCHTIHGGNPWYHVPTVFHYAGALINRPFGMVGAELRSIMERTGFINITEVRKHMTIHPGTELGQSIIKMLLQDVVGVFHLTTEPGHPPMMRYLSELQGNTHGLVLEYVTVWGEVPRYGFDGAD